MRVELHLHEVSLLLSMLSDRIMDSDAQGIPRAHPSSVCRDALLDKLIVAKQALLDEAAAGGVT